MKPLLKFTICIFLSGVSAFISCKKEKIVDSETVLTNNHAPVARAGADQTISLPINSVNLDGSASTDPENNITTYLWTKISGPSSFNIYSGSNKTQATNLVQGVYSFELKVTDAGGLFSMDTVDVAVSVVNPCEDIVRTQISAQLIPFGTLSLSRTGMTIASAGSKILFAGGDVDGEGYAELARVDIYDVIAQTWSTAELSVPRVNIAAATVGNKIFFAGGHTVGQNNWDLFSNVDIYDASTNTWSTAHLSERRMDLAIGVVGNKVFFAGGLGGPGNSPPSNVSKKVDIYDNSTNSWSTAMLSEGRACLSAVTIGNRIYFAGGNKANGIYTVSCTPSNRVDVYDNLTGAWSVTYMNESESYQAATAIGDKIIWAGGLNYDCKTNYQLSSKVEIRDVITQTSSNACLFQPNDRFKAIVKNNIIAFFTGEGAIKNKFDIYDIKNNQWSIGTLSQNFNQVATAITVVNNTIYVAEWDKVWTLEF